MFIFYRQANRNQERLSDLVMVTQLEELAFKPGSL